MDVSPTIFVLALDYDSVETIPSTLDGLQIGRKWLQSCIETHRKCESIESKLKIPTRLIAINETSLQLGETKDLVGRFRYATLSHCWGSKVFLSLVKSKLTSFRVDIPQEELPKTFQDAVFIARCLGFHYLWIDSLCIIQDDKDDWDRESTLMTDVYGGSDLNIVAVSAEDGSVGCFFQRDRKWRSQLTLTYNGVEMLYDVLPAYMQSPRRTPLFGRGWVLQERYLSRRSLYFHEHQIFWDCREHSKCESTTIELSMMRSLVKLPPPH
ncbi:heterokaryon incompatibility protein-domain-containing protein [Leptodontidium sp. 2 PMI_412]|nr:heterokaryon incompatibility protein-domain-containing protein [Leptodontidium sp. 2 PMI_412]